MPERLTKAGGIIIVFELQPMGFDLSEKRAAR